MPEPHSHYRKFLCIPFPYTLHSIYHSGNLSWPTLSFSRTFHLYCNGQKRRASDRPKTYYMLQINWLDKKFPPFLSNHKIPFVPGPLPSKNHYVGRIWTPRQNHPFASTWNPNLNANSLQANIQPSGLHAVQSFYYHLLIQIVYSKAGSP